MGLKLRRDRNDPFEKRRRELEIQARQLAEKKAALETELSQQNIPVPPAFIKTQPPIWRLEEEESFLGREYEPPKKARTLSVQRQRDRKIFIILAVALAVFIIWIIRSLLVSS